MSYIDCAVTVKFIVFPGVGEGNGSDLSVEVICDNSKVMEANCGSLFNCKVRSYIIKIKTYVNLG